MTYKETLFFVARALTVNHEKHNHDYVLDKIEKDLVDWDKVVQLSSKHYIFPALYCNLKQAQLLPYLPNDLVEYMSHITDLNRDRNQQIKEQAIEIDTILKENDINPIFLKGTGFLLQDFYHDIGERMIGDIDFIVSYENYEKTIHILKKEGYDKYYQGDYSFPQFKHYDRLVKGDFIAAIEIHKELILEGYEEEFNYKLISKNILDKNEFHVMNFQNQLNLTIISKQINDDGQFYNDVSLRKAYDVYLLSSKVNSLESLASFKKLYYPLNNYLAICNFIFDANAIKFEDCIDSQKALSDFSFSIENQELKQKSDQKTARKLAIRVRLQFLKQAIYRKENRIWMWNRFRDKEWQRAKLVQLGLLKPKS